MTPLRIDDRVGLPAEALATLQTAVDQQTTLQSAVRWAFECGYVLIDVYDQDEFTRDVVFEMNDGIHLVYDAT